jgi:hypothetical protein
MQRLAIDKIRQYFPKLSSVSAGKTQPAAGESEQDIIDRKTKAFLAEGGEVEAVPEGKTNYTPTIGIVINGADAERRRYAMKRKKK